MAAQFEKRCKDLSLVTSQQGAFETTRPKVKIWGKSLRSRYRDKNNSRYTKKENDSSPQKMNAAKKSNFDRLVKWIQVTVMGTKRDAATSVQQKGFSPVSLYSPFYFITPCSESKRHCRNHTFKPRRCVFPSPSQK